MPSKNILTPSLCPAIESFPKLLARAQIFMISIYSTDGTITTTFGPTPPMPSYLLAFVISDLGFITNADSKQPDETLHRVWARGDSLAKAQYALDTSVAALKALEDYTGFKYEMPKVDLAGVPNKVGNMENWGMLIVREPIIIYEENYDDIPHVPQLWGVEVIAHELAHQFFGNSVTCEWWSVLWYLPLTHI